MSANDPADLQRIYSARFEKNRGYRRLVWSVLVGELFQRHVGAADAVLDLGCGYGEFINQVRCGRKFAMDLNPRAPQFLDQDVRFLEQDCSARWQLEDNSLDVVFTSNFFEHLPDKAALGRTFDEIKRCLKPGGRLIAMGPNIKHVPGLYWIFWDHYLPLTEDSMREGLENRGFQIDECIGRFLPYTMVNSPQYPVLFLSLYLKLRPAWRLLGKQFLVIAKKP